ncbi:MAG: endolytic transglycosylase MltG [Patescibacteria group bacterium]|nr:endolytic transglycosylase MltG [Patescibacteria group bacterium]
MKKRNLFFVFIIILALTLLGAKFFWDSSLTAPSDNSNKKEFNIQSGESTASIANRLEQTGFIRNALIFRLYLKQNNQSGLIQAGSYELSANMDAATIIKSLSHGVFDRKITLIEGWRVEEMADYLNQILGMKKEDFLAMAQEGYMFPDTYFISKDITPVGLVKILKKNLDSKITSEMKKEMEARGLTFQDTLILASIVEREGRNDQDRPVIAGILLKRLKEGMALETDATIQYALGYQPEDKSWWKKNLTEANLQLDSLYNTRIKVGLPPTPIANPGLSSIKAVIYAKETPYWYYAHDQKGNAYYAKTLEEHNLNIAKFLKSN